MKTRLLIILIGVFLFSCGQSGSEGKRANQVETQVEELTAETDTLDWTDDEIKEPDSIVERYFPDEREMIQVDTILVKRDLKISIISSFLDAYVANEYERQGIKHIDKYRDSQKHLRIELSNEVVIDTAFEKEDFVDYAGHDFLEVANFHGYWFKGFENDTIELVGIISKPETDWTFTFYHYVDLKSERFEVKEWVD